MFQKILRENRVLVALFLATGLAVSMLSTLSVHLFQSLLDSFGAGRLALSAVLLYGAVTAGGELLAYWDNYPYAKLENGLYLSFKLLALEKMSTIRFPDYQRLGTGQLVQRVENGAQAGRDILFDFWFRLLRELLPDVVLSLCFIAAISRTIALAVLAGYLVVFLITRLLLTYLYRVKEGILVNEEALSRRIVRGFMELAVFRTNRRYPAELREGRRAAREITGAKTKMLLIHEAFFTLFALLVTCIKAAVIAYGLVSRTLTVGEIVALVTFLDKAYTPVAIFNVLYVKYKLNRVAYRRFAELMEAPDDRRLLRPGGATPNGGGRAEFRRVCCSYGSRVVLRDLSLHIPAGKTTAIAGESGSGKSTAAKLLSGLLEPESGTVAVDGVNLAEADLNLYYGRIAYVSQDAPVFDGTLRENLLFDKHASDAELYAALKRVSLGGFAAKLPAGLDTPLGEKGVLMSGGERQRLALARLWFCDPSLVILDEATSAMDGVTEETVMASVMERLRGRTVVMIAHRLKTVACADQIYVIEDGSVVEAGGFHELIESGGRFAALWKAGQSAE